MLLYNFYIYETCKFSTTKCLYCAQKHFKIRFNIFNFFKYKTLALHLFHEFIKIIIST